jgi:hypothetical protein
MSFQGCQSNNVFLQGAGFLGEGMMVSLDNLASAPVLGGFVGVPHPLETFIFPVFFLMEVGTLVFP